MQHYTPKGSDPHSHQHKDLKSLTEFCINSKHINSKSRGLEYDFVLVSGYEVNNTTIV